MRVRCLVVVVFGLCVGCNVISKREVDQPSAARENDKLPAKRLEASNRPQIAVSEAQHGISTDNITDDTTEHRESVVVDVSEVVEGGNQFALELYQQLRTEPGNLFFSPSSISTALAMTCAGAAGETEAEMAGMLHFHMPRDQLHEGMRALQESWSTPASENGIRLSQANRLWGHKGFGFLPDFLTVTRENYGAELARLDFVKSEDARQSINRWVAEKTKGKIKELLPVGVLTPDTRLVLTNAIYFHGIWSTQFKKSHTKEENFHLTATDKIKVQLMHRSGKFRYGEEEGIQILELPYGDGSLSMIALLPNENDGLPELEAKLTLQQLRQWTKSAEQECEVKVYLPKFKTTSQFRLNNTLKAMGMELAFRPGVADFSRISRRSLYISEAIHKAFVDVKEEGTEAAAATGIVARVISAAPYVPKEPPVFRADHPFVFLIRDNRNGAILFLGRIKNPLS